MKMMLLHDCANIIVLHTAQNQWPRQNVLDAHGNVLFCRNCITTILDVQSERFHKQHLIKQQLNQRSVVAGPTLTLWIPGIQQLILSSLVQRLPVSMARSN